MTTPIGPTQSSPASVELLADYSTYSVQSGDSLYSILKAHYEQSAPALTFPERLSNDQARWLIGVTLMHNPSLAGNPHLITPGQQLHLPGEAQIARALIAGAPNDAAEEALLAQVSTAAVEVAKAFFSAFSPDDDDGFTPDEDRDMLARARKELSRPADFPSYGGPLNPGVALPAPAAKKGS